MHVFDRTAVRRHRDRAAPALDAHDFLFREVGERLVDRLDDVKRRFPSALDLGCHGGQLGRQIGAHGGIESLIQCDLSPAMAGRAGSLALAADEELLPFGPETFDLVLSCLSLHWVNDLPGALLQIRTALKPDGLFAAAMFGGGTLAELRDALAWAEDAEEGGLSPRVSPFADARAAGDLLQRAGFALAVVDTETVALEYADPFRLFRELRAMGETNAVIERRKAMTRRATVMAAAERYRAAFGGADGGVRASFCVLYMTGWAPDPSQQRPLAPGSAQSRLAAALASAPSRPGTARPPPVAQVARFRQGG